MDMQILYNNPTKKSKSFRKGVSKKLFGKKFSKRRNPEESGKPLERLSAMISKIKSEKKKDKPSSKKEDTMAKKKKVASKKKATKKVSKKKSASKKKATKKKSTSKKKATKKKSTSKKKATKKKVGSKKKATKKKSTSKKKATKKKASSKKSKNSPPPIPSIEVKVNPVKKGKKKATKKKKSSGKKKTAKKASGKKKSAKKVSGKKKTAKKASGKKSGYKKKTTSKKGHKKGKNPYKSGKKYSLKSNPIGAVMSKVSKISKDYFAHDLGEAGGLLAGGAAIQGIRHLQNKFAPNLANTVAGIPVVGAFLANNIDTILTLSIGVAANKFSKNSNVKMVAKGIIGASVVSIGTKIYGAAAVMAGADKSSLAGIIAVPSMNGIIAVPSMGGFGAMKMVEDFGSAPASISSADFGGSQGVGLNGGYMQSADFDSGDPRVIAPRQPDSLNGYGNSEDSDYNDGF